MDDEIKSYLDEKIRAWLRDMIEPRFQQHNERIWKCEQHIKNCPHNPDFYLHEMELKLTQYRDEIDQILTHVRDYENEVFKKIKEFEKKVKKTKPETLDLDIDVPDMKSF